MSKIGKKPIAIKEGVTVSQENGVITVHGPLGEVKVPFSSQLSAEITPTSILIGRLSEEKKTKSVHGTVARLLANAIKGVSSGFSKSLEVVGTGYRSVMDGEKLVLSLGFSHPVNFTPPPGIKIEIKENKIIVSGIDRELVGRISDKIKKFKTPDAYKGKGIIFTGEKLKLKPGKAAAKAGATTK